MSTEETRFLRLEESVKEIKEKVQDQKKEQEGHMEASSSNGEFNEADGRNDEQMDDGPCKQKTQRSFKTR